MTSARFETYSAEETQALGRRLGTLAEPGDLYLLHGTLGAGKTTLTQGVAWGAGVTGYAHSPTFVLVHEYQGRIPVYHVDLFRMDGGDLEIDDLAFSEMLEEGACVVEWPEQAYAVFPDEHLAVGIAFGDAPGRPRADAGTARRALHPADRRVASGGRMTTYLVIDTSTRYGAAGLWQDGLSRTISWRSRNNHTAELMPAIRWLTEAEGIAPHALDGIAVSVGPGGFSALRTGIGVAKGLAVAWALPVGGVSTLEASAYSYRSTAERVCAVLPAGRGTVAWAVYGMNGGAWKALNAEQVSAIPDFAAAQLGETLFCGESTADVADVLREHMGAGAGS